MREVSSFVRFARYGALAFEFSGTIAAGAIAGGLVDRWAGSAPYGVALLTVLAAILGFARFIQMLRRLDRLDRASER